MTGIITACMVLCASSITAFAADTVDLTENDNSGNSIVQYTMDSSWKASIPAFITPSEQAEINTEQYSVDVSDIMLSNDEALSTTIECDGVLVEANGVEIPYTLYDANGEISTGDEIISADSGNPDAIASYKFGAALNQSPKYAGTYMGTATFNFSTVSNKIVYSAEDIEKDEHLFAIGETKPEYVVAKFNDDFTEVTIFANGENSDGIMKDFESFSKSPMYQHNHFKIATINYGVTNIGDYAFYYCTLFNQINIPDTVTKIGNQAFYNCSLSEISISNSVTSIGAMAFYFCDSLTNIYIPDSVTSIGVGAFRSCTSLMDISIPENVTEISNFTFYDCSLLETINIPDGVISIGNSAFSGCSSLKSISIPDSVTSIGNNAFYGCSSLETINIPDGVTSIGEKTFQGCSLLNTINIPNSVISIGSGCFSACKLLESISIPDGVASIGSQTFSGCSSLKSISIPNGVTSIGSQAFSGCSSLKSISIPDSVTAINNYTFSSCTSLKEITIGKNVNSISTNAFSLCHILNTVCGYSNTYAETWANSNGYTFVAID